MHIFLKNLKKSDGFDSVYYINYKNSFISSPKTAINGNKYVILKIKDASLKENEYATVFYYYKNESDISFLQEGYGCRTSYLKIRGKCFEEYPNIKISTNTIVSAKDIIFDTSNLFPYSENLKKTLLSTEGMQNVRIRHTSANEFQDLYDIINVGDKLTYERIFNSPHDKYQINVFINDIDEVFNIPAYLTPTMACLIDDGYKFDIIVTNIPPRDDEKSINAGLKVSIKGVKFNG